MKLYVAKFSQQSGLGDMYIVARSLAAADVIIQNRGHTTPLGDGSVEEPVIKHLAALFIVAEPEDLYIEVTQ
jgi:hypothetical protein